MENVNRTLVLGIDSNMQSEAVFSYNNLNESTTYKVYIVSSSENPDPYVSMWSNVLNFEVTTMKNETAELFGTLWKFESYSLIALIILKTLI